MEKVTYKIHKQRILLPDYKSLFKTMKLYNDAIHYLLPKIAKEFDSIEKLKSKDKNNFIEKLFHKTDNNPKPKYADFNTLFPNFPSYFRRTAIQDCIGILQSFNARFKDWQKAKEKFDNKENEKYLKDNKYTKETFHHKPPCFNLYPNQFPTFYKGNMIEWNDNSIKIKVNNTESSYQYIPITLKDKSSLSFKEQLKKYQVKNPKLVQKGKKFFLYFPYEKKIQYKAKKEAFIINNINDDINDNDNLQGDNNDIDVNHIQIALNENLRIMGIDLGINNDAVLSVIDGKGTVLARKFVNFPREKGLLQSIIDKKNQIVFKTGTKKGHRFPKINKKLKNIQQDLQNKIVFEIIKTAKKFDIDYMILENMDSFYKTKKKSLKERFHYWNKSGIQNKLIYQCLDYGIRYRKINPFGTSQYAFDGSGKVVRGKEIQDERLKENNKGIYQNILLNSLNHKGNYKLYNADLNASYNIGSRFIYNELIKLPEILKENQIMLNKKNKKQLQAKVLDLFGRHSFVLADVRKADNLLAGLTFAS